MRARAPHAAWPAALLALAVGCFGDGDADGDHGPVAEGISAPLGEPLPGLSAEQLDTFERGRLVAKRRFGLEQGLGPAFNVTFCAACHERPTVGGSSALYRNFFLSGVVSEDGAFFPGRSFGEAGGVIRLYYYGDEELARPAVPDETNVIAARNAIPFFGVGLIAELSEHEILRRADPDDANGDGISGRPNYDRGFVGRFGRKAQTVSIEGFIRGPLFNHLGITTNPLSDEQRSRLPVDSSGGGDPAEEAVRWLGERLSRHAQAAAPDGPLTDDDGVPDPELSTEDLFDLISFSMLTAAPQLDELDEAGERGRDVFDRLQCGACHAPRLSGPRGPLPVYSDLLLHDMGPALADGLVQKDATGSEFRTQPLWGLAAVGPYLHDGRATTLEQAIAWHGGEGQAAADAFEALSEDEQEDLVAFLRSLGGADQYSPGLVAPDAEPFEAGAYGGPLPGLSDDERDEFARGLALFDRDFGFADGVGQPRFNGDSCRACHFDPVIGGSGPRGVNVLRHGVLGPTGEFTPPTVGTILHRESALVETANRPEPRVNVFEHRQTPPLFGLGLVEGIDEADIVAAADPDDRDGDGISGRVSRTDGGRLGRFGWKAQVPSLVEFVRDAVAAELGMTLPYDEGLTFGRIHDNDDVPDPELTLDDQTLLARFMQRLAPPPGREVEDEAAREQGEMLFASVGCADCHTPSLPGRDGPVALYSDLLLHEVMELPMGIEEASAGVSEFRTPPLWGVADTDPYMHSGEADTLEQAIELHSLEAAGARDAYRALEAAEQRALLLFLESL